MFCSLKVWDVKLSKIQILVQVIRQIVRHNFLTNFGLFKVQMINQYLRNNN